MLWPANFVILTRSLTRTHLTKHCEHHEDLMPALLCVQSLDITGVTKLADKLAQEYEENPTAVKGGLAVAAAGAAAFVLFNEMELVLEVNSMWT